MRPTKANRPAINQHFNVMKYSVQDIQERIAAALPSGRVVPRHNENGHFYEVMPADDETFDLVADQEGPIYPSVTGKLQILKDESLINYKMNQAIQYVFKKWQEFTQENVMEHLDLAARASQDILIDAGDIGTQIHDTRQRIFEEWIKTGNRPARFTDFIDPAMPDMRLRSAIRALEKFCIEERYTPIATELLLYSHVMKVAGTLDDIGIMKKIVRSGKPDCKHEVMSDRCFNCDMKTKDVFVLMDLKSSNQFKPHYWFQVALYYDMLSKLIGIKPQECFILKLSKEDGTYKIEKLRQLGKLVNYAKALMKVNDALDFVKEHRKDNQKNVAEKINL